MMNANAAATTDTADTGAARMLHRCRVLLAGMTVAFVLSGVAYQGQAAALREARREAAEAGVLTRFAYDTQKKLQIEVARANAAEARALRAEGRLQNIESGGVIPQASRIAIARGVYERGEGILDPVMDAKAAPELLRRELDACVHQRDVTDGRWRSPEVAERERARLEAALARANAAQAAPQAR